MALDLGSLESVRAFSKEFAASDFRFTVWSATLI